MKKDYESILKKLYDKAKNTKDYYNLLVNRKELIRRSFYGKLERFRKKRL